MALPKQLAELSDTPVDYFTLECPETKYFRDGKIHDMYPLVEVLQYDRGVAMEKRWHSALLMREGRRLYYV
ncbi:DUF1904 family protein [Veillonella sp. LMAG:2]|uniref:DUF1904 family protein n=1 Tax=Veillonella sp. LMAG:2 TaxID=1969164 RepID=UPI0025FECFB1|nr:DUF1904 family protein [Veillonella sp. LMAG:2]